MTRDRISDLRSICKNSFASNNSFLRNVQVHIKQNKKLHELLEDAEETRNLIDVMIENIIIVKNIQSNVLLHTNQDIREELEIRTFTISQLAHRIHKKLKELGKDIVSIEDITLNNTKEGSAYNRIKMLQYITMYKMYSDTMRDYNINLLRYHHKCSSILRQQRKLLRRQITSEELDDMLESHETSLFVDNILAETKAAHKQLSDIETRHYELQKLEKSIIEVKDIFVEMAFLVERQGEQVNCVEYFANKATDNVDSGKDCLFKAKEKKKLLKKRKLNIALIFCIIVIIIFLMTLYS